jgi:hypothetical protein
MEKNGFFKHYFLKIDRTSNQISVPKFCIRFLYTKQFIYFILFLLPLFSYPQAKNKSQDKGNEKTNLVQLYPVNIKGSFGYINKFGEIVIKPQFEDGGDFKDGLAKIKISGKYGFVNTTGKIVINPIFDNAYDFAEGLAKIKTEGLYGFIDQSGKIVIKPQFDIVGNFDNGLAYIQIANKFGLINQKGEIIFNPISDVWPQFTEGLGRIKIDFKYGFINQKGKIVIKPQFTTANFFRDGLCLVSDSWNNLSGYGYIDKTGKYVIEPQFGLGSSDFFDGIAAVRINKKYGYINKSGKYIIQPQFNTASPFFEGLAWVSYSETGDGIYAIDAKYGCIDKSGKFVINPQNFFWPVGFSEGLSSVKFFESGNLSKYGYINKLGKLIIEPQFDIAQSFHHGWAEVMQNKKWGIVNKKGQYIEGNIIGELIRVKQGDKIGYMNKNFNWVWRP